MYPQSMSVVVIVLDFVVEFSDVANSSVVDDVYLGVTKHVVYATPITMNINIINII